MSRGSNGVPIVKVSVLKKYFYSKKSFLSRKSDVVRAIDGIDLDVNPSETVGLVGESGCGKSTLGRTIVRLYSPTEGQIFFHHRGELRDIAPLRGEELMAVRREMNMVFQDPYSSLNPRKPVKFIVGEPLMLHRAARGRALDERIAELLQLVGLSVKVMERFPHAFSGGQRQRLAVARALALNPKFVVADEAVSALDISIQSQIINLFLTLQRQLGLAYLFISHDVNVIRHVSDRMAVMYLGEIVEQGPATQTVKAPLHPYTEALLSAVPVPEPGRKSNRIILQGDLPNPANPPAGCRFHTRCRYRTERCDRERPALQPADSTAQRLVACHHFSSLKLRGLTSRSTKKDGVESS